MTTQDLQSLTDAELIRLFKTSRREHALMFTQRQIDWRAALRAEVKRRGQARRAPVPTVQLNPFTMCMRPGEADWQSPGHFITLHLILQSKAYAVGKTAAGLMVTVPRARISGISMMTPAQFAAADK